MRIQHTTNQIHTFDTVFAPDHVNINMQASESEGECEVAVFSAKRWDRRNRADVIKSTAPSYDAPVVRPYRVSNPLRLTNVTSKSKDNTTAPQHFQTFLSE